MKQFSSRIEQNEVIKPSAPAVHYHCQSNQAAESGIKQRSGDTVAHFHVSRLMPKWTQQTQIERVYKELDQAF
jgi:hypothetical protein